LQIDYHSERLLYTQNPYDRILHVSQAYLLLCTNQEIEEIRRAPGEANAHGLANAAYWTSEANIRPSKPTR